MRHSYLLIRPCPVGPPKINLVGSSSGAPAKSSTLRPDRVSTGYFSLSLASLSSQNLVTRRYSAYNGPAHKVMHKTGRCHLANDNVLHNQTAAWPLLNTVNISVIAGRVCGVYTWLSLNASATTLTSVAQLQLLQNLTVYECGRTGKMEISFGRECHQ